VRRLANALIGLGVKRGDRVGVLEHDSHRYLELYFAVPLIGAVLHTVNAFLSPDQLAFTIAHAGDSVLILHEDFIPLVEALGDRIGCAKVRVLISDRRDGAADRTGFSGEYEALLAAAGADIDFPDFDENTVATLFYTTGTTGDPKGVYFSHRQIVLHTLAVGMALSAFRDPFEMSAVDVYLPLTPMFHVHSWGFPYIATVLGMKQVYQGRHHPQTLARLLTEHQPTVTHGVPTVLRGLLNHPAYAQVDFSRLKMLIGGSALTEDLLRAAGKRGLCIVAGYGMSETCPVVSVAHVRPGLAGAPEAERTRVMTHAGMRCRRGGRTPAKWRFVRRG
jgi:fatty-acyl-CoA synthase